MTNEEKLNKANNLRANIRDIKEFLEVVSRGLLVETDHKRGPNFFTKLELVAECWTGSQTASCHKTVYGDEVIKAFCSAGVENLKEVLRQKEEEFENVFK